MQELKAVKSIINYGEIPLEVYQLPDGHYELSQTQVAKALNKPNRSFIEFLEGKSSDSLINKDFKPIEVFVENGRTIKATPIKIAVIYWAYWASKGNTKAQALVAAGTEETITRLADNAFGVVKTEQQYNQELTMNVEQNQLIMSMLSQVINQNSLLLQRLDSVEHELKILRPAYEEIQVLNKSFKELHTLKDLLEEIASKIDSPNQKSKSLRDWLKDLSLDNAVDTKKAKAIGRVIADWLKIGNLQPPARPAKYPECLVPLVKLATEYQLFHC